MYPAIVREIDKGGRTFFKLTDSRIVIGRNMNGRRWVFEGTYSRGADVIKPRYGARSNVKFTEIFINAVLASEGDIPFDATPLRVDGEQDRYLLILVMPRLRQAATAIQLRADEDIFNTYIYQVALHEMNHVLTETCVTETGDLNALKSELLADIFLIQDLATQPNAQHHLDIKRRDIRAILSRANWEGYEYYRRYLTVIDLLLSDSTPERLITITRRLQDALTPCWDRTPDDLYDLCVCAIESPDREPCGTGDLAHKAVPARLLTNVSRQ